MLAVNLFSDNFTESELYMAKPTSFRHPVLPISDDRIAALIGERGAFGYGLYWMIIETLYREESMQVECCDKQIRRMAAHMCTDLLEFRRLLKELVRV